MKPVLYLICFSVITALYGVDCSSSDSTTVAQTSGPRLVFEEETFDFGTIEPGRVVEHVFLFRNAGSDTVFIRNVGSS